MKTISTIGLPPKIILPPPPPLKKLPEILWWLVTLTVTRQLMSNKICYQVSKLEMEFHVIDIIYAALPMREQKDDIFMQRRLGQIFTCLLKWGQGSCKKSKPFPARAYKSLVVLVIRSHTIETLLTYSISILSLFWENILLKFSKYHSICSIIKV